MDLYQFPLNPRLLSETCGHISGECDVTDGTTASRVSTVSTSDRMQRGTLRVSRRRHFNCRWPNCGLEVGGARLFAVAAAAAGRRGFDETQIFRRNDAGFTQDQSFGCGGVWNDEMFVFVRVFCFAGAFDHR